MSGFLAEQETAAVDRLLATARRGLDRVGAEDLEAEVTSGALLIDLRPIDQRQRDGELPGAIVVDRNVLEWRLDPSCPHRLPQADGVAERRVILVCTDGFSSSLAAATLQRLGVSRATDLVGGYKALLGCPVIGG